MDVFAIFITWCMCDHPDTSHNKQKSEKFIIAKFHFSVAH